MEELFEFEGQEYTLAEVQKAAEAKSLNIDDYIKEYNISRKPGKTTPTAPGAVVEETAAPAIQPTVTESPLVDTSLELPKDKPNILQSLAARTARGFASTFKGLQAIPENIIFGLGSIGMNTQDKVAFRKALSMGIPGSTSTMSTDQFDTLIDDISEHVRKTENESVTEAISKGNITEAAELTVGGALESFPSILAAMTGYGGIALFGTSVAGNKFDEEFKNDPTRSTGILAANAIGSGAIEAGFELATRGLLKQFGIVNAKSGKEAAKKLLEEGAKSFIKKTGVAYTKEAGSEAATELTQILFDKATLDKDINLGEAFTRVADAGIIGGFMGGTISTVAQIGDTNTGARNRAEYILTPESEKQKMQASAAKISNLAVDLESAEGDAAEIIKKEILKEESNILNIKKQNSLNLKSLNKDQLKQYASNVDKINKNKNIDGPESAIELAKIEINNLTKQNNEIIDLAKSQKLQKSTEFAEKVGTKIGKNVRALNNEQIISEFGKEVEGADGFVKGNEIIINKDIAKETGAVTVGSHEVLHPILESALKGKDQQKIINDFKKIIGTEQLNIVEERLQKSYDADYISKNQDEYFTVFSDAILKGEIKYNDNIFTKLGDLIRPILRKVGFSKIKFETGKDVYNFLKEYNKSVAKGDVSQEIIDIAKETEQEIKTSRTGDNIQKIFDEKGKDGAFDIIEAYKPLTTRLTNKYRDVPGFDFELLQSEIEIGKRGLLDLINAYDPSKGATLNTYIQGQLANRSIEAANRILDTEFKLDVTEAKSVTDTVTAEETIEAAEQAEFADEIKSLRKEIGLSEELVNTVKTAVIKTFGTKLPNPQDPKFRLELQKRFRTELKKPMAKFVGKQADYESFLRDNFQSIYNKLPQSLINRRFKDFQEPVLDNNGKHVREKTAEGNKVYTKKKISKAEFIKYFLGSDVGRSTQGTRKTAIVEAVAEEIAFDATMEVLNDPAIIQKYQDIAGITGEVLPENFKSIIAKQVDRAENFKFSKSLINDASVKYSLTQQELGRLLFEKTMTELANEFPELADSINNENFKKSYPKVFYTIVVPAFEKAINKSIAEGSTQQAEQIVISFIKTFSRGTRTFSTKKGELNLTTNRALWENVIYPAIKGTGLSSKKKFNLLKSGKKSYIRYGESPVITLIDVTNKDTRNDILSGIISKEEVNIQNRAALNELKNIIFNIGNMHPGLALSIIKVNQKDQRTLFRNAAILNRVVQNYKGDTVYEHNPPVQYVFNEIVNYLSNPNKNKKENLISLLNTMEANLVPKDFAQIVDKKFKDTMPADGTFRYDEALAETNYTFDEGNFKFSKTLNREFNEKILEATTNVDWFKKYSPVEARIVSRGKGNKKFFIPYSADDFVGLLYATLGKGKVGNEQLEWYQENLIKPFSRGIQQYESAKQNALREWNIIKKEAKKDVPGGLQKRNETGLTNQDSVRLYIWKMQQMEIPGIDNKLVNKNLKIVLKDEKLKEFAERLMALNPEGYPEPSDNWDSGDITTDIVNYINSVKRTEFLQSWNDNVEVIFSEQNKNKLRALYGDAYVDALNDILYRMETGRNRKMGISKIEQRFMDWTNNSVGAIMFFNARSAVLQTLSAVNFINFTDNNPINAGIAFANQPQYWKDFSTLFNSDFLKQRRTGLQTDISSDEIARAAKGAKNTARAALSAILKFGFTPTQIADSFAIASGGATFYRNRINKYKKEGLEQSEAEEKAFTDFQEIAEETQQSARPDRISMQQAGSLGRIILAFGNTPMQYARLTKKAALDLVNGRGDWKTNISKIMYYSVIQNIIFSTLQQGLFALLFSDEEDDKEKERIYKLGNGILDSFLRGTGVYGAAASTVKNMVLKTIDESQKNRPDYTKAAIESTSLSPPINSKIRKLMAAGRTFTYKQSKEKVFTEGFSLENPALLAAGQIISAGTNLPADRVILKADHIKTAMEPETELWQAIALSLGWSEWDLGMIEKQTKKSSIKKPIKIQTGLKKNKIKVGIK